jgi:uncharacterized membrane protein YphA (DoxX/SURF4 family)
VSTLAGPFLVAVVILGAAGAVKVVRPATTAKALAEMGLGAPPFAVRAGALVELAIAAGALVGGGRPFAALVAASYAGFATFVLAALRRGTPLSTCGCFGTPDTPPTAVHLGLNLAAAAVALAVALTGSGAGGLAEIGDLEGSVLLRVAFLASTATSVWLAFVALTVLPKLQVAKP